MVDKNGKLFGKINLIDFLIILVLVLGIVFVALRFTGVIGGKEEQPSTPVMMSFFGTNVPDYVVDNLEVGAAVYDYNYDIIIGYVASWEDGDPLGYIVDDLGDVHKVNNDGERSLTLNVVSSVSFGEDYGATIEGENRIYGVGHTTLIYAGLSKLYIKVSSIEPLTDEQITEYADYLESFETANEGK